MLWGRAAVPALVKFFRPLVVVPCLVKGLLGGANPAAAWDAPVAKAFRPFGSGRAAGIGASGASGFSFGQPQPVAGRAAHFTGVASNPPEATYSQGPAAHNTAGHDFVGQPRSAAADGFAPHPKAESNNPFA